MEALNVEQIKNISLTTQEKILFTKILDYYKNIDCSNVIKIIRGETKISKRLIDFYLTNYCKTKNKIHVVNNKDVLIHNDYKSQLKMYSKKYFDPFGRGQRIPFFFEDDAIITTIGQMNFFKWFNMRNLENIIDSEYDDIDMSLSHNKSISNKTTTSDKKIEAKQISKLRYYQEAPQLKNGKIKIVFN